MCQAGTIVGPLDAVTGDASGGYVAEDTDYISNRIPSWIPVGPGCCGGTDDLGGNQAAFAVYGLVSAPEIDPSSVASALMLLVAGVSGDASDVLYVHLRPIVN
jgi:hypothetical protein